MSRQKSAMDASPTVWAQIVLLKRDTLMAQGTIKKIISDKGFGFIKGENEELFFHRSAVEGISFEELREGQSVQYNEGQGPKGKRAENVRPA